MTKKEKELERKRFNRELGKVTQEFCCTCGGLKKLWIGGLITKPENWMRYGMASDVGCVC